MWISQAAELSGASPRAIRLYESMGLLNVARHGKYRVYSQRDVEFIKLIKEGQSLGVQLSEMLALKSKEYEFDWQAVEALLDDKKMEIQKQIDQLHTQLDLINRYQSSLMECEI